MSLSTIAEKYCPQICRPLLNRVQQSPIGKRLMVGVFWSMIGNCLAKAFPLLTMIFVARILGKEGYGEFGFVRSASMIFVTFASFGPGLTATKYIAELLHKDKERTGRIIGLSYGFTLFISISLAIIFFLLVPWICETQLNQPQLTNVMRLGTLLLFITTYMSTQISIMTGFQDFRGLAITNGLAGLTMFPIYLAGAYLGGLTGTIVAAIIAVTLNFVFNGVFIYQNMRKHQVRYEFRHAYKEISLLWTSSVPLTLVAIIYSGMVFIVQMELGKQSDGIKELGLYYAAMNYQMVILVSSQVLLTTFFPNLCDLSNRQQSQQYWKVVKLGMVLIILASICSAVPLFILSDSLMRLNGPDFANSGRVLISVGILGIINSILTLIGQIQLSLNKQLTYLVLHIIDITVALTTAYFLLKYNWGALAVIGALIAGRLIYLIISSICLTCYAHK